MAWGDLLFYIELKDKVLYCDIYLYHFDFYPKLNFWRVATRKQSHGIKVLLNYTQDSAVNQDTDD